MSDPTTVKTRNTAKTSTALLINVVLPKAPHLVGSASLVES
jgi:hypothetical protein